MTDEVTILISSILILPTPFLVLLVLYPIVSLEFLKAGT